MTEPALLDATPTGLPYPLSTDPANQGANAIKALALALDPRAPYQVEAGAKTVAVSSSGPSPGIATITFDRAFTTPPRITAVCTAIFSGSSAGSFVPAMGLFDVSTTQARFFILAIPWQTAAGPIQPWGGNVTVNYFAAAPA